MYFLIKKILDIRERIFKSTHEDTTTVLKKIDEALSTIVPNLENIKKKTMTDITKNYMYHQQIENEIFKIKYTSLDVNINSIRKTCKDAGIDCSHIGTHLSKAQILQELEEEKGKLVSKMQYGENIMHRMRDLLHHIDIKKPIQTIKHDTRDTQSMRNVIGISIAVCAIVTLCIVLLIAVHNKHRANAEVRLVNWV